MTIIDIRTALFETKARSAWSKGVKQYALDLTCTLEYGILGGYIDEEDLESPKLLRRAMLNGAQDWTQFSYGGCALIYDESIANQLCNRTELKRTDYGRKQPNNRENWLDVQARALYQASELIISIARDLAK
jgi:hypothetical protein